MTSPDRLLQQVPNAPETARVVRLPVGESDVALVAALRADHADARALLFDRCSDDVERTLYRILGPDQEIADLLQDVFVAALGSLNKLRDPNALRSWLVGIAVYKARKLIRSRKRRRHVYSVAPSDLPEQVAATPSTEISDALRHTYAILNQLPADERIAFSLRFIEGLELTRIAEAMGVSLATVKRRLTRAQQTFVDRARRSAVLADWLRGGTLAK